MTEWTTVEQVKGALGIPLADSTDDDWLTLTVAGVNQFVDDTRPHPVGPYPEQLMVEPPDDRTVWGAVQLATRWYSRRNSADISAYVELGGPPPSIDRDIEVALRIGRNYGPAVA